MSASTADTFTDAFLAERVAYEHLLGRFRYCKPLGGWLRWNGMVWEICNEDQSGLEQVRQFIRALLMDAVARGDDADALKKYVGLQSKNRISAIELLARGIDGILTEPTAFDTDPWLLNARNGVVDLRTGELKPHDPDFMMMKVTAVDYVEGATHEDWSKAREAIPADAREWFDDRMGQAATGSMPDDDLIVVFQGGGENGKTTVIEGCMFALGTYADLISDRVLIGDARSHTTDVTDLFRLRMGVVEELPEHGKFSISRVKKAVGTPRMKARRIAKDNISWDSTHSIFISTNYLPVVEETDRGTWRRIAALRFRMVFVKPADVGKRGGAEKLESFERVSDLGLRDRLLKGKGQQEAVLATIVRSCVARGERGGDLLPLPDRVIRDTEEWREDSDILLRYINERLEFGAEWHVDGSELLRDFNDFLRGMNLAEWGDRLFSLRFGGHSETTHHGIQKKRIRLGQKGVGELSREPMADSFVGHPGPSGQYTAWLRVKFRPDRAHASTSNNDGSVQDVQGDVGDSLGDAYARTYEETLHTVHNPAQTTSVCSHREALERCAVDGCENVVEWVTIHLENGAWRVCNEHAEVEKLSAKGNRLIFAEWHPRAWFARDSVSD